MSIESLRLAPMETRKFLRARLAAFLPTQENHRMPGKVILNDQDTLSVLLEMKIAAHNGIDDARRFYESRQFVDVSKSFDDLLHDGWVYRVRDRLYVPGHQATASLRHLPEPDQRAITALHQHLGSRTFAFSNVTPFSGPAASVVKQFEAGQLSDSYIGCPSPAWVAARLWEYASNGEPAEIGWWIDRWRLLGTPAFAPSQIWGGALAKGFMEEALKLLAAPSGFASWDEFWVRAAKVIQLYRGSPRQFPSHTKPDNIVDAAVWISDNTLELLITDNLFGGFSDLWSLTHVLLREVSTSAEHHSAHALATKLFELAVDRPELLKILTLEAGRDSRLLADLLLFPQTSAFACAIIAEWRPPSSSFDRDLWERDFYETQLKSFYDSLHVLSYFLAEGSIAPSELAALAICVYTRARTRSNMLLWSNHGTALVNALKESLATMPQPVIGGAVDALSSDSKFSLGSASFAVALEIVSLSQLEDAVKPDPFIAAYVQSIREVRLDSIRPTVEQISAPSAASLVNLALRTDASVRDPFWVAVQPRQLHEELLKKYQYSASIEVARSIRCHIQVLSRAVAGWGADPPERLKEALIEIVKLGTVRGPDPSPSDAFAPNFEIGPTTPPPERFIAQDLADALRALPLPDRKLLLSVIVLTDEPFVLAKLLALQVPDTDIQLRARLAELPPSKAADIMFLTDATARVEALLDAGETSTAAAYFSAEQELAPDRKVPWRAMSFLRSRLRLLLLEKDWESIRGFQCPEDLVGPDKETARETIFFFQGVAELQDPNGDPAAAVGIFARLWRKHRNVGAYGVNWVAAELRLLLRTDAFLLLEGEPAQAGRRILAQSDQIAATSALASPGDRDLFQMNRAILLLALGRPDAADQTLRSIRWPSLLDSVAAYSAVALFRRGQTSEASAMLATRPQSSSPILQAAAAYLQGRATTLGIPAQLSLDDNDLRNYEVALHRIRAMAPMLQARVAHYPANLPALVFDYVRGTAAAITALVPMMKRVELDGCEDDLTSLFAKLLTARFTYLGWSAHDNSRGGFSEKGNPGKPDILLNNGNTTVAAIEAVRCEANIDTHTMQQDLIYHFQKLFGYSNCDLFIYVVYDYSENDQTTLLSYLRKMAGSETPSPFQFSHLEFMERLDSTPAGFIGTYREAGRDISILFLVLDLALKSLLISAQEAAVSRVRRKKKRNNQEGPHW